MLRFVGKMHKNDAVSVKVSDWPRRKAKHKISPARPFLKFMLVPEKTIQRMILTFLAAHKIFVFRINTTGVYDTKRNIFRTLHGFSMKGVADILGMMPDGRFLAIEVKTAKGVQSFDQKHFEECVKKNNGIYILARSVDDVRFLVEGKDERHSN
jgi:hypothetical protein